MIEMSPASRQAILVFMKNQRQMNEEAPPPPPPEIAQFKRISIPLIRRIYPSLHDIMSVQPLQDTAGMDYFLTFRREKEQRRKPVDWAKEGF